MTNRVSLQDFYKNAAAGVREDISKDLGHFNAFEVEKLYDRSTGVRIMPYRRRDYYKISLVKGHNKAEYADKVIEIQESALVFATPKIPYHWLPQDDHQHGLFCIFTPDFLAQGKTGLILDELPLFQPGQLPIFQLTKDAVPELEQLFRKMLKELDSDYRYKYDLLRNLVLELIHYGQKLQPIPALPSTQNAAHRIAALFIELLERQFPLEPRMQQLQLRTAKDYADRLAIHVNHLNKVMKENTGSTTTELIARRIIQEAKILLKQTEFSVSEIAFALGYEDPSHFSNFFKKQTSVTALAFRQ